MWRIIKNFFNIGEEETTYEHRVYRMVGCKVYGFAEYVKVTKKCDKIISEIEITEEQYNNECKNSLREKKLTRICGEYNTNVLVVEYGI